MPLIDALLHQATAQKCPISGTFELTARCNLSCKMCYIHNTSCDNASRDKELTTAQWIDLAEQAKNNGTLILLLTGGEPTLREDFCEIYRACAERGFLLTVNTNGTLLSDRIIEVFKKHPPLRVNVSLYATSESTYKSMCGNGNAFFRVCENLKRLRKLGIGVQINFSDTPYNRGELEKVYQFANGIGASVQHAAYMFPPVRTACHEPSVRFTPEECADEMFRFLKLSQKDLTAYCRAKIDEPPVRTDDCGEVSDGVRCRAGRGSFWITYDGSMIPCGMLQNIAFSALSNGFEAAWKQLVAAFSEVKMPVGCTCCPDYHRCDVCPAICYAENGDFSVVPSYICRKNSAYRKLMADYFTETEGHT